LRKEDQRQTGGVTEDTRRRDGMLAHHPAVLMKGEQRERDQNREEDPRVRPEDYINDQRHQDERRDDALHRRLPRAPANSTSGPRGSPVGLSPPKRRSRR